MYCIMYDVYMHGCVYNMMLTYRLCTFEFALSHVKTCIDGRLQYVYRLVLGIRRSVAKDWFLEYLHIVPVHSTSSLQYTSIWITLSCLT